MKKWIWVLLLLPALHAPAQTDEAQQLMLNVEKLAQLKKILQNMKQGAKILYSGYTKIKNISAGSYDLHEVFLDGLLQVSPAVRQYKRVEDIIRMQLGIAKNCKNALQKFKGDDSFTIDEINYLTGVYEKLAADAIRSLEELTMVLTAGNLRMSDDERLKAIDRIYEMVEGRFQFARQFNGQAAMLSLQRRNEQSQVSLSKKINGY